MLYIQIDTHSHPIHNIVLTFGCTLEAYIRSIPSLHTHTKSIISKSVSNSGRDT